MFYYVIIVPKRNVQSIPGILKYLTTHFQQKVIFKLTSVYKVFGNVIW